MRRTFNLHRLLGRFFTENEMSYFRSLQSQTGLLISGSTALQFFERVFYPESDLDLYVEKRYSRVVVVWLISIGYTYEPRPGSDQSLQKALEPVSEDFVHPLTEDYLNFGVVNVHNFHKSDPDCKIQLVVSRRSPLEPILTFHSTCVMNVISHEKAYSLYPRGTFNERRSLVLPRQDENEERSRAAREKYIARGWNMVQALTRDEILDPTSAFFPGGRYVGDSKCWTIPILPKLQLPEGYIGTNSWDLNHNTWADNADISFTYLVDPLLRHSYLVKETSLRRYILPRLLKDVKGEDEYDDDLKLRMDDLRPRLKYF